MIAFKKLVKYRTKLKLLYQKKVNFSGEQVEYKYSTVGYTKDRSVEGVF